MAAEELQALVIFLPFATDAHAKEGLRSLLEDVAHETCVGEVTSQILAFSMAATGESLAGELKTSFHESVLVAYFDNDQDATVALHGFKSSLPANAPKYSARCMELDLDR